MKRISRGTSSTVDHYRTVDYIRRLIEAYELWWLSISKTEIHREKTAVIHSNTCMCHCIDLTVDPGTQAEEFANNEIK